MTFNEAMSIANGNQQAALFLVDWDAFCGIMDDVIDEPGTVTDEVLAEKTMNFIGQFCNQGFARENAPRLWPLMVVSINAWLDANKMAKSNDLRTRLSSDVVKSHYSEMERAIAFLCGGHEHMRKISAQRRYDYDMTMKEAN